MKFRMENLLKYLTICVFVYIYLNNVTSQEADYDCYNSTVTCDNDTCGLPECRCWGYDTPGGLSRDEIPQMVLFTFMKSFDKETEKAISDIFKRSRRNPNGGHIATTLYVTEEGTDYCVVRRLWEAGHEIAAHGLEYKSYPYLWQSSNQSEWTLQMVGLRQNVSKHTGIDESEIRGMRAPYFESGADTMFAMITQNGFLYDSTQSFFGADSSGNHGWPLTLDFRPGYDECMRFPCPTKCYRGTWEIPNRVMTAIDNETLCSSLDVCEFYAQLDDVVYDTNDTYYLFQKNFDDYYNANKAPVMFNLNPTWFKRSSVVVDAMSQFLDDILSNDDVYIVSSWQAIEWMKNPTSLENLNTFRPWLTSVRSKKSCVWSKHDDNDDADDDDLTDDVTEVIEESIFDSMFSGNGLVAIELLFFCLCAFYLIARDNETE